MLHLSDADLLARLLPARRRTKLAEILARHGNLAALCRTGDPDLSAGDVERLAVALEIGRRALARSLGTLRDASDAARHFAPLALLPVEELHVVGLRRDGGVMGTVRIASGGAAQVAVATVDVVRVALGIVGAARFVLAHNHPGGDPAPSRDDVALTARVIDAFRVVGMELVDHVIVAKRADGNLGYACAMPHAPRWDLAPARAVGCA